VPCFNPFFYGTTLPILDLKLCLGSLKDALYILISYAFWKNDVLMSKIAFERGFSRILCVCNVYVAERGVGPFSTSENRTFA
jgi:hypothetical protein